MTSLSHELRTPLNAIVGKAQLMKLQQQALQLSENEQQLLLKLIAHQGKIVSRTEFAQALGGQAQELLVTYRDQGDLLVQEWPETGLKEGAAR